MKKVISIILAVLIAASVFSVVPFSVSAAETEDTAVEAKTEENEIGSTSGTTGYCTWTLDNGVLIISGNGAMGNYSYTSSLPWEKNITLVIIENGVTNIGKYAFYKCNSLEGVVIPDSVTSIGDWAFFGCTSLTSVTIPDSVKNIGTGAFYGCTCLKSVTIPDSVTSIGEGAFYECTGLTSVTIPDSVTSIGNYAFGYTGLTSVIIPDSVTSIGINAFDECENLTKVNISNIAAWCSISFADSSSNPLYYAHNLYLNNELVTELIIPDSVTSIGSYAFSGCTGLKSVTIPDSITSISYQAFRGCTGLKSITIPDSVTSIGEDAFRGCTGLTSVTIGNGVTSIGRSAFYDTAWYNNQPDGLIYAGKVVYKYKGTMPSNTSIVIKEGTKGIADYAFYKCTGLTSVTIPDSVTSIDQYAFYCCTGLTSVTIPDSVTSIGNYAFIGCDNLTIYGYSGTVAETYANSNNIPFVSLAVEPTTEEPTTVEPTEQPTTAVPTTVEPTTVEPTVQPTTEPATLPYLNVNVISAVNSEGAEVLPKDFSLIGDSIVSINKGDTFTFSWKLDNDSLVPESIQWFLTYDKDALQIVNAAMPETNEGSYLNKSVPGVVWGNVTNANGFTVDKDAEFITMTFKALDGNIKDTDVKMTVDQIIYKNSKPDQLIIDGEPANDIYDGKYYVDGYQKQVTGLVDVNGTFYLFDENYETDGVFSGLYTGESGTRYFQNGKPQNVGLIKIENEIYCTSSGGYLVHGDKLIYSSRTNGILPPGTYHFDEETGKLYKDNVIIDDVYYKEDKAANVGIVKVAGDFYVTTTKGIILKDVYDKPIYSGRTNGLVAVGNYDFGPDGKMILKNGIINGKYYKDGKATNIGCFAYEINGVTDIYCTTTNGVLIKNAQNKLIYNSRTNGLVAAGYYDFDADGKMTIHKSE